MGKQRRNTESIKRLEAQRIAEVCRECQVTREEKEKKRREKKKRRREDEKMRLRWRWSIRKEKEEREKAQSKEAQRQAKECGEHQVTQRTGKGYGEYRRNSEEVGGKLRNLK